MLNGFSLWSRCDWWMRLVSLRHKQHRDEFETIHIDSFFFLNDTKMTTTFIIICSVKKSWEAMKFRVSGGLWQRSMCFPWLPSGTEREKPYNCIYSTSAWHQIVYEIVLFWAELWWFETVLKQELSFHNTWTYCILLSLKARDSRSQAHLKTTL